VIQHLSDFEWYADRILRIQTKVNGLRPLRLRKSQRRFLQHLRDDFPDGIVRSISLKPRQAGWSTLIAGINVHKMATSFYEKGIMLADKFGRTQEVHGIYSTYVNNIPLELRPMVAKNNSDEIWFDNPDVSARVSRPGLGSGFRSETAQDPNAGRSGTRKWAHLTEFAFYPYADSVDEGIQNSIPLAPGTRIFKESTAYGMAGIGESFFNQWNAAMAGESIYKPFFVAWFEIDDYALPVPRGFILTKDEVNLVKRCPEITNANLVWRRLKLKEYAAGTESVFTPEERFKQDFPSYPEEAFLSTGRPVFDLNKLKAHVHWMREHPAPIAEVKITKTYLAMYPQMLTVFRPPQKERKYVIGADVAEGVETGDFSNAFVIDAETREQVAVFHGHIDPDHFGHVLVDLAEVYNKALINPEVNNMGHTTVTTIKGRGYLRVYMRAVYDEIDKHKETLKMGWRTTSANKQQMLSRLVAYYRDDEVKIRDAKLLGEMMALTRESSGDVELTGKDRVVAACLSLMGLDQLRESAVVIDPSKKERVLFEGKDLYRDKVHAKRYGKK
jgi:hypothetical protein